MFEKKYYHRKTIQRKFIENLLKVQWSSKFIKNLFVQKKIKESTYYDSTVMNRMHSRCFRKGCLTNSWRSFLYQISICFSISRFDKFTHGVLSSCRSCSLWLSSILQSCHRHRDLLFMLPSSSWFLSFMPVLLINQEILYLLLPAYRYMLWFRYVSSR